MMAALLVLLLPTQGVLLPRAIRAIQRHASLAASAAAVVEPPMSPQVAETVPIASMEELAVALESSGDGICIVKFHASYCRTCKAVSPRFERVARANAQHLYLEVDVGLAKSLARHCRVTSIPYVQAYSGGELIAGTSLAKSKWPAFESMMDRFSRPRSEWFEEAPAEVEADKLVEEAQARAGGLRRAGFQQATAADSQELGHRAQRYGSAYF